MSGMKDGGKRNDNGGSRYDRKGQGHRDTIDKGL
jgi:hypothetical protein